MRRAAVLMVLLAALVTGCGGAADAPPPAAPGAGCAHRPAGQTCAVLFAGNSLTFVNDLPGTFARLAREAGRTVVAVQAANAGETLTEHVASGDVATPLREQTFNVVVIQEQSKVPAAPDLRAGEMYPAAHALIDAARAEPAQPMLFNTWAADDGWPERGLIGFEQMQRAVDEAYGTLAASANVPLAPVGDAFRTARADVTLPSLVADDGYHPSPAGTYLAACVFYATIFGADPRGLAFHAGLDATTAARLQAVAARTALGRATTA